jgi:type II secretory pathway predicted ATPase ExeA
MEPFSSVATGRFYYDSPRHAEALTRLRYAVDSRKGLALLAGSIGAGKTTLARRFLDTLAEERYEASLIVMVHSSVTSDWILKKIAHQMGVEEPSGDKLRLLGQLYERLVAIHEGGKRAVVLIDEAQMLRSREIMEEFRGLLNMETDEGKLITLVLFGLPEVEESLKLDEPLAQRVGMRIRLEPMDRKETEDYIRYRLSAAGNEGISFTPEALSIVYRCSNGIPRLVNTVCDNALLEAFLTKKETVDREVVTDALEDLGVTPPPSSEERPLKEETPAEEVDEVDLIFKDLVKDLEIG